MRLFSMPLDFWSAILERDNHLEFLKCTSTTHWVFSDSDLKPSRQPESATRRCNSWRSQSTGKKKSISQISNADQSPSQTAKVSKWSATGAWTATPWSTTTEITAPVAARASWGTWLASIPFPWSSLSQLLTSLTRRWLSVSEWTHQRTAPRTLPESRKDKRSIKTGGKRTECRGTNKLLLLTINKMTWRTIYSPNACLNNWRTKWTQRTKSQLKWTSAFFSTWDTRRCSSWTTRSSAPPSPEGSSRTWSQMFPSPCASAVASASSKTSMSLHTSRRDTAHSARMSKKIKESRMFMEV